MKPIQITLSTDMQNTDEIFKKKFTRIASHVYRAADAADKEGMSLTADYLRGLAVEIENPPKGAMVFKNLAGIKDEL